MRTYTLLILAFLLCTASCEFPVKWPRVAICVQEPATDLVQAVYAILSGSSDVRTELETLARKHGASTILCIVQSFAHGSMASGPAPAATPDRVQLRAQAFLAEVQ
jgi:hypothetical protein